MFTFTLIHLIASIWAVFALGVFFKAHEVFEDQSPVDRVIALGLPTLPCLATYHFIHSSPTLFWQLFGFVGVFALLAWMFAEFRYYHNDQSGAACLSGISLGSIISAVIGGVFHPSTPLGLDAQSGILLYFWGFIFVFGGIIWLMGKRYHSKFLMYPHFSGVIPAMTCLMSSQLTFEFLAHPASFAAILLVAFSFALLSEPAKSDDGRAGIFTAFLSTAFALFVLYNAHAYLPALVFTHMISITIGMVFSYLAHQALEKGVQEYQNFCKLLILPFIACFVCTAQPFPNSLELILFFLCFSLPTLQFWDKRLNKHFYSYFFPRSTSSTPSN